MKPKLIPAFGIIPDTRQTWNSNVGLTELPATPYTPLDPKDSAIVGAPLAAFGSAIVDGYPGQVHHQHLSATWNKDSYWGRRKP